MASSKIFSSSEGLDSVSAKKAKFECTYGERCYRKKQEHFEEYTHPHLENLLDIIGDGDIYIPDFYSPRISRATLMEQLAFHRKMRGCGSGTGTTADCARGGSSDRSISGASAGSSRNVDGDCDFGSAGGDNHDGSSGKDNRELLIGGGSTQKSQSDIAAQEKISSGEPPKKDRSRHEDNLKQMENYRVVVWDRRKMKVTQKLEAASPYNFFLTTITDSKPTHNDMLSISFPELLDPTLGNLESSLQVNFMVEFGWLLAQYHIMGHRGKPLTLLYGETDMELSDRFKNFLTHVKVVPPSPFGSHHTKMMVMAYTDGSIRVVVATANLVESDWDNRTQGLWMSEKLPKLSDSADTGSGDSPTNFKRDLIRYLSSYQLPELTSWIGKLKRADMSKVNVFFIASIPGKHVGVNLTNWGQMALKTTLRDYLTIPKGAETYPVIVQTSSIGSLGPKPESWLLGDMLQTFTAGKKLQPGPVSRPDLKFIYPSFENVAKSYDGLLGGGCLPYSKKTHSKQEWLTSFMCQWMSDCRDRTRAPPHIKTYCRVSPDMSHLSYFLLTSANLSKAAWGSLTCAGSSLNILSYEAGVLMLPQFVVGEDFFPLKKSEGCDTPIFPMPYDLPTKPYSFSDVPWFFENLS